MEETAKNPIVTIDQGRLKGTTKTTINGLEFCSFLGIPYGKPPVGSLRFSAPSPPEPWIGVMDASVEGSPCSSKHMVFRNFIGTEDCLFLNIFTPKQFKACVGTEPQHEGKKAVMVWIHGGGFAMGSSEVNMYGPDYLLDGDIVLVTINYRLGPLGFLSTGDGVCSGNWGLKDQVMALKWIQKNIHAFGGDPDRVTIFGESAGGASVNYHLLSPMSKGLFHRAIAQSGSALNPWAYRTKEQSREMAFLLGRNLGFNGSTSEELLDFLRRMDDKDLIVTSERLCPLYEKLAGITFAFVPTTEEEGPDAFLSGIPLELTNAGKFNQEVTFVAGVTTAEGFVVEFGENSITKNLPTLEKIDQNIEILVPPILGLARGSKQSKEAAQKIKSYFFGDKPVCLENISQYYDTQSDLLFLLGIDLTVRRVAMHSFMSTFYYQFSFEGLLGMGKKIIGLDLPGVCHGDDLGYLFNMEMLPITDFDPQSPERKVICHMVKLWTNIAKTGHPLQGNDGMVWDPVSAHSQKLTFLDINENLNLMSGRGPQADRMKFWDTLFKEHGGERNYFEMKLKEKL